MSIFFPQNPGFQFLSFTFEEEAVLSDFAGIEWQNGDIAYYDNGWNRLPIGSDGQAIIAASGLPIWATVSGGGGGGDLSDGDKGDITVSGGGLVWQIDSNVIGTNELDLANIDLGDFENAAGFITDLSGFDTDDLIEGSTNLYLTTERVQDIAGSLIQDSSEIEFLYDDGAGSITANIAPSSIDESKLDSSVNAALDLAVSALQSGDNISDLINDVGFISDLSGLGTDDLDEGILNLYFTNARADARIAAAVGVSVQEFNTFLDQIASLTDPGSNKLLFFNDSTNAFEFLTLGTNLSISGTTLNAAGGSGPSWSQLIAAHTAEVNVYYITNSASRITVTLPTTAAVGSTIRIAGLGSGGWKIAQNASGVIHFGTANTTTGTGGYLESTERYDAVELLCVVEDTEWAVISSVGNITVT